MTASYAFGEPNVCIAFLLVNLFPNRVLYHTNLVRNTTISDTVDKEHSTDNNFYRLDIELVHIFSYTLLEKEQYAHCH